MSEGFEANSVKDNTERGSITSIGDNVISEADSSQVTALGLNSPEKLQQDEKDMMGRGLIAPYNDTTTGWNFLAWQSGDDGNSVLLAQHLASMFQPDPEISAGGGESSKLRDYQNNNPDLNPALQNLSELFPQLVSENHRLGNFQSNLIDHIQQCSAHRADSPDNKLNWFREQASNDKPWDLKAYYTNPNAHTADNQTLANLSPEKAPLWVQNYGNFHYGATAYALGLDKDFTQRMAGWAQLGGSGDKQLNSLDGMVNAGVNYARTFVSPNHGDADANDQLQIQKGWEWAQKYHNELGISE